MIPLTLSFLLCTGSLVLICAALQPPESPPLYSSDYIPDTMASASGVGSYSNPLKKFK